MKVYHGSPVLFEEIDTERLSTETAVASYGHGFYTGGSPEYPREHLMKSSNEVRGGVIYEMDIPVEEGRILQGNESVPAATLLQAKQTALEEGNGELADYHDSLIARAETEPNFDGNEYYRSLSNLLPNQKEVSDFLVRSGIDALTSSISGGRDFILLVMNTNLLEDINLTPVETVGLGPVNPDGTRAELNLSFEEATQGPSFWDDPLGALENATAGITSRVTTILGR